MANEIFENVWKVIKENKFILINQIDNDLICHICNRLMVKACNAPCGCKYCSDCVANYLDGKDKFCPGEKRFCQMKMINFERDIVIDYRSNITIAEIVVKCPNKNCEFKDELGLMENHMRTCNKNPTSCPYFEIGCKNDDVINDEMKDHLYTEIYCHTKLLVDFINNLRNDIESIKNENAEIISENKNFRKDIESVISKISEIISENENLKKELKNMKIESQINHMKNEEFKKKTRNENTLLMNKLVNIEKSLINEGIEIMKKKLEQQTQEINEMKDKYEQILNENIEMKKKSDEMFNRNADLILKSNNYNVKINYLQMKIIEMKIIIDIMNFEEFEWKIENLSQQKQGIDIYSESFYSHKNGYKMCLSVSIYVDYIHVYCYIMKGEFDKDLIWPFKYGITIDIINQMNGTVYTSRTIKYDEKRNDQIWSKPTTERNDGIYFHQVNKTRETIRNNQMLIKCKIKI